MNDFLARRYRGLSGPMDERLMSWPWWLKEAVWGLHLEQRAAETGLRVPEKVRGDPGALADWIMRAEEETERQRWPKRT